MRKLLALTLTLLLLSASAFAMELPYDESTIISVVEMTDAQKALADFLYEPIFCHEQEIQLPEGTLYDDVSVAMGSLMQDYPELFHLGYEYNVLYYRNKPEYAAVVKPQYRMSAQEAAELRAQLYAKAYMLVQAYPDAESLHDAMCNLAVYGGTTEMLHTAVGALLQGQAKCAGYAQALTLLYRMAGIPCGMIIGDSITPSGAVERHAWNIAELNGYTLIDSTWNDQDANGHITHWFFGLSTALMNTDHTPDAHQRVPYCGAGNNWHAQRGYVVYTDQDADAAIRRLVAGEAINLRIPSAALYAAMKDAYTFLGEYNERNPEQPFYGLFASSYSDTQQCLIIRRVEE